MSQAADLFYLNADVYNGNVEDVDTPMTYTTFRAAPLLDKADDWIMSVIRFSVPFENVPYMEVKTNEYYIGFSWAADNYVLPVSYTYLPTYIFPNGVWEFQYFVDRVNQTLRQSYAAMLAAHPTAPTSCPFIMYNPQSERFVLYYPEAYINHPNISLWTNNRLQILFGFTNEYNGYQPVTRQECKIILSAQYTNGVQNRIVPVSASAATPIVGPGGFDFQVPNYTTLPPTYSLIDQNWYYEIPEKNTNYAWVEWQKILIISNTLPNVREYIGATDSITQQDNTQNATLPIVTDFVIDPSVGVQFRSTAVFNPTAQWRWSEFTGAGPLNSFDMTIALQGKNGAIRYPTLPASNAQTIKLVFCKKSFMKNNPELVYKILNGQNRPV